MFHGKEVWSAVPARARVGLFHKVVDAIVDEPVVLILRSVNETRLRERQTKNYYPVNFPPEQVCFQHILQRVDRVARRDTTHALIIADERGDRERHRERFATYQTEGTPGVYMHTTLDTLLDPSRANLVCRAVVTCGGEDVSGGVGEWVCGGVGGGRRW